MTLASANGSIVLAIQDGSPSAPVRSRPDVTDMSGRGLMIVELLSQAWGTSTDAHGFKSVWASFPMSDPRGPPRSRTRSTIARATFAERLAAAARAA